MERVKKIVVTIMICIMAMALPLAASAANVNKGNKTVSVGHKIQLKVDGKSKNVKWITSNKKIATVTKKGQVTGKKVGTAKITAKVGKNTYFWKVSVKENKFVCANQNPSKWTIRTIWPTYNVLQMYYKSGKLYTKGFWVNPTNNLDYTKIKARVGIYDRKTGIKIASKNVTYNKLLTAQTWRKADITFNKSEVKKQNFDLRTMSVYTVTTIY